MRAIDADAMIDRLKRVIQNGVPSENGTHPISAEAVLEVVRELSEHGTNLAEVGTDLISRQAAIDAIAKMMPQSFTPDGSHPADKEIFIAQEAFADCIKTIEILPPAQPEIIRCRNCKFASGDSRICMKFGHSPIGELDFCAWAERRTDE